MNLQFLTSKNVATLSIMALAVVGGTAMKVAQAAEPATQAENVYSWQQPHSRVLPNGALEWAPKPFVFEKGDSARYIDFDAGDDARDGKTPQTSWKHHPWDADALGRAGTFKGVATYIFKGGVAYRGALKATESGTPGNPIRLTRDPAWGKGEATFNGSFQIAGGWKKGNAREAPGIPEPENVWYQDIGKKKASSLWQVVGDKVERMDIARWPNIDFSDPDDPLNNWPVWSAYDINTGKFTAPALKGLGDRNLLDGATLWSEGGFLMAAASVIRFKPGSYDPVAGTLVTSAGRRDLSKISEWHNVSHFMIENVAKFLDASGEYFYQTKGPQAGRIFLIPVDGVDPNRVVYELAQIGSFIRITNQHDIVISGLDFRHNDPEFPSNYGGPCVSILGSGANITVKNCSFYYVSGAVSASVYRSGGGEKQDGPPAGVLDNIIISDNDIQHVEKSGAIFVAGGSQMSKDFVFGQLKHVEVMRNRLIDTAFRHGTASWSSHPAIAVHWAETGEIAGNIIDRSYGNGIITFGGKSSGAFNVVPLTRLLVHHNQIDNTMLDCNDYGGLEHFQGGPIYLYNNITRNAVGNKVLRHELGYNLYLDGGFKCYAFNNIIAGKVKPDEPDYYNYAGYMMCFGFMDQLFNNTIYHFENGLIGNSGNRSNIVGNVIVDCKKAFINQNQPSDVSMLGGGDTGATGRAGIPTMAYANNVFFGNPTVFGAVAGISSKGSYSGAPIVPGKTLEELREKLGAENCRLATIGWKVDAPPLANPAAKDYRLAANSGAKKRGVKYFVPWALAREVGEWNFYKSASNPQTVLGEAFYMTDEYLDRSMYYFLPRNDLTVSAAKPENYTAGPLEDWTDGALVFDGKDRVASLSHAEMTRTMEYPIGKAKTVYDGTKRETLDMGVNNFLIEVVCKTEPGRTKGVLASKSAESGYELAIGQGGGASLILAAGGARASVTSTVKINDGKWHHVLAEADRAAGVATIYVDGNAAGTGKLDAIGANASLANTADFIVGKGFAGAVDFLRVCRSTLAESKTSIEELYAWEFNGPALRDFTGRMPSAARQRDAGAMQGED